MSSSPRDENRIAGLIAKSDADNTPVVIEADPVTKRLKTNTTITGNVSIVGVTYATRIDDSATPIIYIGKAPLASITSDSVWQISKLDTSSGLIKTWADGNADFDNVWDDRATTITYS